ncbi:MAG: MarR family winged helix-turn-helix transcriptional regulator [Hyphomicrobiales bacterium]
MTEHTDYGRAPFDYERAGHHAKSPLKLWLRLFACATLIEAEISRRLRASFDISLAKFDFLAQLYRSPDGVLTMSQLGQCLMVTGGNITGLTDRLEREGLAERRPHPTDRRSQVIGLTDKGRAFFETMAEAHEDWIRELLSGLDDDDQEQMMEHLGELKDAVLRHTTDREA